MFTPIRWNLFFKLLVRMNIKRLNKETHLDSCMFSVGLNKKPSARFNIGRATLVWRLYTHHQNSYFVLGNFRTLNPKRVQSSKLPQSSRWDVVQQIVTAFHLVGVVGDLRLQPPSSMTPKDATFKHQPKRF